MAKKELMEILEECLEISMRVLDDNTKMDLNKIILFLDLIIYYSTDRAGY